MTWIQYKDLVQPNGGWRYMFRVRRGEFDDVPIGEVPRPDVRSTWGQYSTMERTWFYGVPSTGLLSSLLVVVGAVLIATG